MIREAVAADIPAMVQMGAQFHQAAPIADLPYDPEKVADLLAAIIGTGGLLVVERDGDVRGMAAAVAAESWFGSAKVAQELFWWCESCGAEALDLRRRLEGWAKKQGCVRFIMGCLNNEKSPVMIRLYRREGYAMTEHHFMKEL